MMLFANILTDPAMLVGCLGAGLLIGWLTRTVTEEPSYGTMGDLILGSMGGLAGGLIFGFFKADAGFWGCILVALGAACVVIASVRTAVARSSS